MSENSHFSNPFILDLATLTQILAQTYEVSRKNYDQCCQLAIDKKLKAQMAAIELLNDAHIKPYVSLGEHLSDENQIAGGVRT